MSRYFKEVDLPKKEERENDEKETKIHAFEDTKIEVFDVPKHLTKRVKWGTYRNKKSEGIQYERSNKRKAYDIKREIEDPFPGRKPVDPKKLKKYSKGMGVDLRNIKGKVQEKELERQEETLELAAEQAARGEILLPAEAGYLEGDDEEESMLELTQTEIKKAVDEVSATKSFDLNLQDFGPYKIDYTRNGKYLLIGGRRGHVAAFDWASKRLMCEINAMESVHSVRWLHTENLFAVAQKKWTYVYDNTGVEIHCVKKLNNVSNMEYLPYHFLLATGNDAGFIHWLDVSIGKMVKQTYAQKHGDKLDVMCQNPANAAVIFGHSKGTVTMWTPNMEDPAIKIMVHKGSVRGVACDRTGTYLATANDSNCIKIYDIRALKCLQEYSLRHGATNIKFSQRNLLGVACGNLVEIYKDPTKGNIEYPYMKHQLFKQASEIQFCPYEDVMGIGHGTGFTSILVPGAGEPNFDTLESNPYRTKKQRREVEVQMLLDKISYELISVDSDSLTGVDASTLQQKLEDQNKSKIMMPTTIVFDPRNKMKRKGGTVKNHYIRKHVQEQAKQAQLKIKLAEEDNRREGTERKPPKVFENALDRFR